MKKLICITGRDGVGKSTLVDALAKDIPHCHVANIWDLLASPITSLPFQSKQQIDDFLCAITPDSRLLFLAHALTYSIDAALKTDAQTILLNSYYYKYFATELALGANRDLVRNLADHFPTPDLTIELKLSVGQAAKRKDTLSRYECGLVERPSVDAFQHFQTLAEAEWTHFRQANWQSLDAQASPASLLAATTNLIKEK